MRSACPAVGVIAPAGSCARLQFSRRRTGEARERLTAQELQIARMAADGLANREIGQQLYLSHRTVGAHLYRIFPKLGITARGQSARRGSPTAAESSHPTDAERPART